MGRVETDVLIVGGGFGGATAAKRLEALLASSAKRVQLVAPDNFPVRTAAAARLGALGRPSPLK